MQVNRAVVDRLVAAGVDTVFGIPGTQSLPLNEALADSEIRFVVARHETAVSHQAWGYAETSGRLAATVVVPGPGDMNAMNGLKNALNDCTPLLHLAIETEASLRGGDAIHETPPETYDTVVKENVLVETAEGVAATLDRAVATALTPPMGPVRVGIPKDLLAADASVAPSDGVPVGSPPPVVEAAADEAADLLADADRPVVIAGGGVRGADAGAALRTVAERLGAPVVTTYKGKGVLPEDHALSAGVLGGSAPPELLDCLADADAALAVGTDLDAHCFRGWTVDLPERLVHVTLDPADLGTGYEPTVGLVADALAALVALEERLAAAGTDGRADDGDGDGDVWAARPRSVRGAFDERVAPLLDREPLSSVAALRAVREALPREATVSVDAGGFRVWGLNAFPAFGPRRYVNPGSWATMGTGLPGAIGAACATPDAPAVALTGDGGLLMCLHELHTVVIEGLPVTVVVFNNSDYAIISEDAARNYTLGEGAYAWGDAPISFTTVAEGLGMDAVEAATPDAVREAIEAAVTSDEPTLVEVATDPTEPQASEFMGE